MIAEESGYACLLYTSIYELVLEHGILDKKDLDEVMDPKHMTQPSKLDHIKPKKQL